VIHKRQVCFDKQSVLSLLWRRREATLSRPGPEPVPASGKLGSTQRARDAPTHPMNTTTAGSTMLSTTTAIAGSAAMPLATFSIAAAAPEAKAGDTRQRLVEAATNLFWEKGYAATGLSEVLKEAGARAGSLYHFFPTKELLLLAVLDHHKLILETVILRAGDAETDAGKRVLAILGFYRQFMQRTQCALGCPIANLAAEVSDTYPAARDKAAALFDTLRRGIGEALASGRPGRSGISPGRAEELAAMIVAVLHGGLMQSRAARSMQPLELCLAAVEGVLHAEAGRGVTGTAGVEMAGA